MAEVVHCQATLQIAKLPWPGRSVNTHPDARRGQHILSIFKHFLIGVLREELTVRRLTRRSLYTPKHSLGP